MKETNDRKIIWCLILSQVPPSIVSHSTHVAIYGVTFLAVDRRSTSTPHEFKQL